MKLSAVFSLAGAIALLDAFGKWQAIKKLPENGSFIESNFFSFTLHKNPGIAFDISVPLWILSVITIALAAVLIRTYQKSSVQREKGAIILILTGAAGNFGDRLINGFTTDYLLFFKLSAINLSDLLIICGCLILLFPKREPSALT